MNQILFATYFGSDNVACTIGCNDFIPSTIAYSMAVDAAGEPIVAGSTTASDLPTTPGVYSTQCSCKDIQPAGFVAKFSANGSNLVWSTFLPPGSSAASFSGVTIRSVSLDGNGNVVLGGVAPSPGLPVTSGVAQGYVPADNSGNPENYGGFVAKLDAAAQRPVFATYFGGGIFPSGSTGGVQSMRSMRRMTPG